MLVSELVDKLIELMRDNPDGKYIKEAIVVAEDREDHFFDVVDITHTLRYTPHGIAVLTLGLRKTDE